MTTTSFEELARETRNETPSSWQQQLAFPDGWIGTVVGRVMAIANGGRNRWVVDGLGLQVGELVVEIGSGPGVALDRAAKQGALVVGVDPSETMQRAARKKNRRAVAEGRVRLVKAKADRMPLASESVDVVFAVESAAYWDDLFAGLCEARRVLRAGGRIAIAARDEAFTARLVSVMRTVGFQAITVHRKSPSVLCVTGIAVDRDYDVTALRLNRSSRAGAAARVNRRVL